MAANVYIIKLHNALQLIASWPHHGSAQLVEKIPRRPVAPQAQYSLQPQGACPIFLAGDLPHRLKPKAQWQVRVHEQRAGRDRSLVITRATVVQSSRCHPNI